MDNFIAGIKEKYPKELLTNRLTVEGNVIGCLFQDPLLIDDCQFKSTDFITQDGAFYYQLAKKLRNAGYTVFDEVTILSSAGEQIIEAFNERGGFDVIKKMTSVINLQNAETYLDTLFRENIMLGLHSDGFNLLRAVKYGDKEIVPYKLFRKMTSEEVLEWYEARLSEYGVGYSTKVLEEEELEITDDFISRIDNGLENGIPFDIAGQDSTLKDMSCFPYLSNQILGIMHKTMNVVAGFSSSGKTSFWITILMGLIYRGEKVLIISNEQQSKVFKIDFLVWIAYKYFRYYGLTKQKLTSGNLNEEEHKYLLRCKDYFNEHYKGKVKFISIPDSDISLVKKKVRQNVLRYGYSVVLYDTMKVQLNDVSNDNSWLSLIKDSRTLDTLAKKYGIIMLASLQLASSMISRLWLNSDCLSTSKQTVEVFENLLMLRSVYPEELDKDNTKYYCRPFQKKCYDGEWVEEEYEVDPQATYKFLFLEKVRNGANSNDTGAVLMFEFKGEQCVFKEVAFARPRRGLIGGQK